MGAVTGPVVAQFPVSRADCRSCGGPVVYNLAEAFCEHTARLTGRHGWPICLAEHRGMVCDRRINHAGDHVDVYGPSSGRTWPRDPECVQPWPKTVHNGS